MPMKPLYFGTTRLKIRPMCPLGRGPDGYDKIDLTRLQMDIMTPDFTQLLHLQYYVTKQDQLERCDVLSDV